jgi:hypothetical protein
MNISLWTRVKSIFAGDKAAFWWNHFTDYELSLSRMTLTELASELQRTQVRHESANTIVVEHMLAARLARIQSRASWWSGWLGFAGAMLAAGLTFYLGQLAATTNSGAKAECASVKVESAPMATPATVSASNKQAASQAATKSGEVQVKPTVSLHKE